MARQHQGLELIAVELTDHCDQRGRQQHVAGPAAAAGLGSASSLIEEPVLEYGGVCCVQAAAQLPGVGVEVGLLQEAFEVGADQLLIGAEGVGQRRGCACAGRLIGGLGCGLLRVER